MNPWDLFIHARYRNFRMQALALLAGCMLLLPPLHAQTNKYASYFAEAYRNFPSIPAGLLEAVAYTNTRVNHVSPKDSYSCQGLPEYYGVMGLVGDGKGYFQESLKKVAQLSGYSEADIIENPRINILAYAAAYVALQRNKRMTSRSVENHEPIISELSELPAPQNMLDEYARDQQFYGILKEIESPHTGVRTINVRQFDYNRIFGSENYRVLSAKQVNASNQRVRNLSGDTFSAPSPGSNNCSPGKPNYFGSIWDAAHTNNYGSRNGEQIQFITIHTIQGSYASAIAWFKNRNAKVSAHYIIRASDGQVTQMVCEDDKAFHVKTDNAGAIGIEHEGFIDDGAAWYTNEMYESSAALVRDICKRRGINPLQTFAGPPTSGVEVLGNTCWKIKGHQHFRGNNHIDPGPYWDWDRYYRLINGSPTPQVFTDRKGEIFDTGKASGNYGDQQRLAYLIKPKDATSIRLEFLAVELEGTREKPYDYLDIYDGENVNGRYIGRIAGDQKPGEIVAKSGAVYIEFRSDCRINKSGWHIRYSSTRKNPDCPNPTNLVAGNRLPTLVTLSWQRDVKADHYLIYLKRKLENKWALYRTKEKSVTITGLSANGLYNWQVQAVCGTDSSALVGEQFITPNIGRGDRPQVYTVRLNRGRFNDSGGTLAGYANEENYLYRIIPPDGGRVELTFTSFDTEESLDVMTIFDGGNTNGKVLAKLEGKKLPPKVVSSQNGMTILFKSDRRETGKGWTASWRSLRGATGPPVVDNGNNNNPGTPTGPTQPTTPTGPDPIVDDGSFNITLPLSTRHPETSANLQASYNKSFTINFADRDRSGRGLANRFYNVAQQSPFGFQSNPQAGFFYDDFDNGLKGNWKNAAGNWQVENGRLRQSNVTSSNANLHAPLRQQGSEVYVYAWQAKMTGNGGNLRHGLHFFSNNPSLANRGNSYFVWIRDGKDGDYAEIYKTVNNAFDRKVRKQVNLGQQLAHDYKVIYNPQKGRIELYIDNKFAVSWVDRYPLRAGNGISVRSGNCQLILDNLIVFKQRTSSAQVAVNQGVRAPLNGTGRFLVNSLIIDRNIRWSEVGQNYSELVSGGGSTPAPPAGGGEPTPAEPTDESGSVTGSLAASYRNDFSLPLAGTGSTFYLPADFDGQRWGANSRLGFFLDDFPGNRLHPNWTAVEGNWRLVNGELQQSEASTPNSNLFIPVRQRNGDVYMYHWRAKILSEGDNKRFGMHMFCSDPAATERGNSYLVWFRNYQSRQDKVEIYRTENNSLIRIRASEFISLKSGRWYD